MAEQSHKREMNDAVRGDFERLRARRQRRGRADPPVPVPAPARVVLTPPPPPDAHDAEPAEMAERNTEETSAVPRRSWVRTVLRRR